VPPEAIDAAGAAAELSVAIKRLRSRLRAESMPSDQWTISQLSVLARLVRDGPATASRLAQAEHVRPQSIAEIVGALRAGDLVAAKPDPTDGRKTLLRPTAGGRRLVQSVWASREAWLARAIESVVDESRRASLADAIGLLNDLAEFETAGPVRRRR
jgi:DNA-binding MarR family transcriptional regulator